MVLFSSSPLYMYTICDHYSYIHGYVPATIIDQEEEEEKEEEAVLIFLIPSFESFESNREDDREGKNN